jgi:hypothetical protein
MCDQINDTRDYCDYTSIKEKDIVNLVNIINIYKARSGGDLDKNEEL